MSPSPISFSGQQFTGVRRVASSSSSSSSNESITMAGPSEHHNTGIAPTAPMVPAGPRAPVAPMAAARLIVPSATTMPAASPPPITTAPSPHEVPSITLEGLPQTVITHINELNDQNTILQTRIQTLHNVEAEAERLRTEVQKLEHHNTNLTEKLTTSETLRGEVTRALQQAKDEEEDRKKRYKLVKRKAPKRVSPSVNGRTTTTTNRVRKSTQVTAASLRPQRTCRSGYRRD